MRAHQAAPNESNTIKWVFLFRKTEDFAYEPVPTGPQAKPSRDLTSAGRPEALMREG